MYSKAWEISVKSLPWKSNQMHSARSLHISPCATTSPTESTRRAWANGVLGHHIKSWWVNTMVYSDGCGTQKEWQSSHICLPETSQWEHTVGSAPTAQSQWDTSTIDWSNSVLKAGWLLADPPCKVITTFITPSGRYYFNKLLFGIASVLEHFQKWMAAIPSGLNGVVCQMDDVLVIGSNQRQPDDRLTAALKHIESRQV